MRLKQAWLIALSLLMVACGSSNNNINNPVGSGLTPGFGSLQCPLPSPFPTTIISGGIPIYLGSPTPFGYSWFNFNQPQIVPEISVQAPQSVTFAAKTNYIVCPGTELRFVGSVELGEADDDFWDLFDFFDDNFDRNAYSHLVVSNGIDQAFAMESGDTVVFDSPNPGYLSFGANADVVYSDSSLETEYNCTGDKCEIARFTFMLLEMRYLPQ